MLVVLGLLQLAFSSKAQLPVQRPGQPGQQTQTALSTELPDSIEAKKDSVPPHVARLWPFEIWRGTYTADTSDYRFDRVHIFNEADTLNGFLQSIGQVGKPYQLYRYGLNSYYLSDPVSRNPVTGQPEVYILNPSTDIPHYDTRTPYVVIHFQQTAFKSQYFSAHLTQNINPFWNIALIYKRRASEGPYINQETDHYNIAFSLTHQPFNKRLLLFVSGSFNQLSDGNNGGVLFDPSIQELTSLYFPNTDEAPVRIGASGTFSFSTLRRKSRSFNTTGSYRLVGDSLNNLSILGEVSVSDYYRNFGTQLGLSRSQNQSNFRTYARVFTDVSGETSEEISSNQYFAKGGLRVSKRVGPTQVQLGGEASIESNTYFKAVAAGQFLDQTRTTVGGRFAIRDTTPLAGLRLQAYVAYTVSNLFSPEQQVNVEITYASRRKDYSLPDTVERFRFTKWVPKAVTITGRYAPLRFDVSATLHNRNPSIYNTFWSGATFLPSISLQNELVGYAALSVTYTSPPATRKGTPYQQSYYRVGVFASAIQDPIVSDFDGQPLQYAGRVPLQWFGLTLGLRRRVGRFYGDLDLTAQAATAQNAPVLARYTESQPAVYGKAAIYYLNKFSRAADVVVRIGFESRFFTDYKPLSYDPSTQVFYPGGSYIQPSFIRADFIAELQFSNKAMGYVNYQFLNNLIGGPFLGYLTTPFYPEYPRMFAFGVRYRFFD